MAVVTKSITLEITYDDKEWHDPVLWDWSELVGDAWTGPTDGRRLRLTAMHLD